MTPRIPISAANWKMHKTNAGADALCDGLRGIERIPGVEVVIAPGFLQLARVAARLRPAGIGIAGQNMYFAEEGPFTGEVSPVQLAEVADWVILGHSERRQYFAEDDAMLRRKVAAALAHGLRPLLCVGERLDERETGHTNAVLQRQLTGALAGVDLPPGFVVAYEPVWAIGSGRAATPEIAQETAAFVRAVLAGLAGAERAAAARILYGGSVKADNVAAFAAHPDIDGALVGGASLDAQAFLAITRAIAGASAWR